uniref:Uncharacterized protein n=1 Tax=Arundo donax TaxID=35708 RepID=A0A0A9AMN2_ARUDO
MRCLFARNYKNAVYNL